MPREPITTTESSIQPVGAASPSSTSQHGFDHQEPVGLYRVPSAASSGPCDPTSRRGSTDDAAGDALDADRLDEKLRGLKLDDAKDFRHNSKRMRGRRIADYENALVSAATPHHMGFKVSKRSTDEPPSILLTDFPNGNHQPPPSLSPWLL